MTDSLVDKWDYLHDSYVYHISLFIDDSGGRLLSMQVHCNPDCGFFDWNDKLLTIEFVEPLIIHGTLFGHMANAVEINMFDLVISDTMSKRIKYLTDAGIASPPIVASIAFQSGSQLDIACEKIRISDSQIP